MGWATEAHRTLLLGNPFTLQTDHNALKYRLADKASVGRLARWSLKLQEFVMKVQCRIQKSSTLGVADFMSRIKERLGDKLTVGAVQLGMAEGDVAIGVRKASVKAYLEQEEI